LRHADPLARRITPATQFRVGRDSSSSTIEKHQSPWAGEVFLVDRFI
jgi:hypothetical protein